MKKLLIALFGFITVTTYGQDAKYMKAMEKTVLQVDSAKDAAAYQSANNSFERIAQANTKEWLPLYYQSFCHVMIGMKQEENSKKDEYFDKAEVLINKADSISPDNSEIYVLKSLITSMKISIDPMTRGQKMGMQAAMLNQKAIELDKGNPRAYFLRGQGLMYTPPQYGGGKDKALPVLEEAVAKYKVFIPSSPIMPHWGEAMANSTLEQCKSQ